jgi:general secretion pathway protein G
MKKLRRTRNFIKFGFTLIEILVVVTIIVLITAAGTASYAVISKQSRDAKRKGDLEQIRSALEMYRSNNDTYPINGSLSNLIGPPVYIQSIPTDPKDPIYTYYYYSVDSTGAACTVIPCVSYTLGAYLETTSTCTDSISCTGAPCNYCVGPYGQK